MNRFTNLTPSQFDPLSWEEVARVPLHKRTQHTAAETAKAELETAAAQLDSLPVHDKRAREIQDYYRDRLGDMSSKLASEGINQNTTQEVLKLNSQFKQDFSPLGDAGKIMAAKTAFNANKQDFYGQGYKAGHSGEYLDNKWSRFAEDYANKYGDNQVIEDIGSLGVGKYYDVDKTITDEMQQVGKIMEDNDIQGDYKIAFPGGVPVLQSVTNSGKTISNLPQLQQKLKDLYDRFTNEEYESGRFASDSGFTSEAIQRKLNNALGAYLNSAETTGRRVSIQNIPTDKSGKGRSGSGKTSNDDVYTSTGADNLPNATTPADVRKGADELMDSTDPIKQAHGRNIKANLEAIENDHYAQDPYAIKANELLVGNDNNPGLQSTYLNVEKQILGKKYPITYRDGVVSDSKSAELAPSKMLMTPEEINTAVSDSNRFNTLNDAVAPFMDVFSKDDPATGEVVIYKKDPTDTSWTGSVKKAFNQVAKFEVARVSKEEVEKIRLHQEQVKLSEEALNKKVEYDKQIQLNYHLNPEKTADLGAIQKKSFNYLKNGFTNNLPLKEVSIKEIDENGKTDDSEIFTGDSTSKIKEEILNLMTPENTILKGMSLNGSYSKNDPVASYEITIPGEDGKKKVYNIELSLNDYKTQTPGGTLDVSSSAGEIISLYKEYGGVKGAGVAKRAQQQIDYSNISMPTFSKNYDNSQQLVNSGLVTPNLKNATGSQKFDFDLIDGKVGLVYQSEQIANVAEGEARFKNKPLTWNTILLGDSNTKDENVNLVQMPKTKEKIQSLPPQLTSKLVDQICKNANVPKANFNSIPEEKVDSILNEILSSEQGGNYPITADSHYDLLDLIKQI